MGEQENYEEDAAEGGSGFNRNFIIIGIIAVIAVVIIVATINIFNGVGGNKASRRVYTYKSVFERLTAEEASKLREELSYSGFHFKTAIDGKFRTLLIRDDEVEDARLDMARRGLPSGGAVGFEIFDKSSNLGVTDFDKRIKYIRAISGELSRNISRIRSILNARVQIVMPEEKSFSFKKIQATSSVLIQRKPGFDITVEQVKGIMYLVSSSVEGLKPENVTVVDMDGNILSERVYGVSENVTLVKEELFVSASIVEDMFDYKGNVEKELSVKAQEVLDKIFPVGSTFVVTNVDISIDNQGVLPNPTKINMLIMLDDKNFNIKLTKAKKDLTYSSVAAAVNYVRGRDRIQIKRSEFVKQAANVQRKVTRSVSMLVVTKNSEATTIDVKEKVYENTDDSVITKEVIVPASTLIKDQYDKKSGLRRSSFGRDLNSKEKQIELVNKQSKFFNMKMFVIVIVLIVILIIASYFYKKSKAEEEIFSTSPSNGSSIFDETEQEDADESQEVSAIREMADNDSSKIADVLKDWLSEDKQENKQEDEMQNGEGV